MSKLIKSITSGPYRFVIYHRAKGYEVEVCPISDKSNDTGVQLGLSHYDIQACEDTIKSFMSWYNR